MYINRFKLPKYLIYLIVFYITTLLSSAVMGYHLVSLGFLGFKNQFESGATITFPLWYIFGDVIAKVYGYKIARHLIWVGMFSELLFVLLINGVNYIPSPGILQNQSAYNDVVHPMLRFVLAGIIAVTVGSFLNVYIISKLKVLMKGKYFLLRSIGSTAIGDIAVALISGIISYIHIMPFSIVVRLLAAGYLFTLFYGILAIVPASLLVNFLKRKEGYFVLDGMTSFNPFSLKLD